MDLKDLRIEDRPTGTGRGRLPLVLLLLLVPGAFVLGFLVKGRSPDLLGGSIAVTTEAVSA
ncbi:MAG: hypothetical protein ACYS99_22320, partial [Planctomycetota bacterium]